MKTCTKCHTVKPLSEFYNQPDRGRGTSYCKVCKNQYDMQRWSERKTKAVEYKGGCCEACGYSKYQGALEFHHINPAEKDVDWGQLRLRSWYRITAELDKCALLCSNCHKEEHHKLRQ